MQFDRKYMDFDFTKKFPSPCRFLQGHLQKASQTSLVEPMLYEVDNEIMFPHFNNEYFRF